MTSSGLRRSGLLAFALAFAACSNDGPSGPASNRAPQIRSVSLNPPVVPVGGSATVSVEANDPDGDPLFYRYDATAGTITPDATNAARAVYVNDGAARTADQIHVTVLDSSSAAATASATITLQSNRDPSVEIAASPSSCHPPCSVQLDAAASDPDNDELTYVWSGCASGTGAHARCSVSNTGPTTAAVFVFDGKGGFHTATIAVDGTNAPPRITRQFNAAIPGFFGVIIDYTDDGNPSETVCGWLGNCLCSGQMPQGYNLRCSLPSDRGACYMEFACTDRFGGTGTARFELPE
jgi:hypothetical protein